jgi:hypothetical protein
MPGKYADSFELGTDAFLNDRNVTIQFATFRTDASYNNGNTLVCAFTMTDESDTYEQLYSVGGDWTTPDGGYTVERIAGKKNQFSKSTNFGKWLAHCALLPELWELITDRGPATDARIWTGIRVHLTAEEETYTIQGESKTSTRIYPDAFLGVEESPLASTPQTLQPQTPTAAEILARAKAASANGAPDKLTALAISSSTHQEFLEAALAIADLTDDDLVAQLVDENLFYKAARS